MFPCNETDVRCMQVSIGIPESDCVSRNLGLHMKGRDGYVDILVPEQKDPVGPGKAGGHAGIVKWSWRGLIWRERKRPYSLQRFFKQAS